MTSTQPRLPVECSLARTTLGVDLASTVALAVAAVVFRGPPAEIGDDVVVSVPLLGVACTGLLQLAARGGLSYATKSAGILVGLWPVGVLFDLGTGYPLTWVDVVAGGCAVTTHVALVRAALRPASRPLAGSAFETKLTNVPSSKSDSGAPKSERRVYPARVDS